MNLVKIGRETLKILEKKSYSMDEETQVDLSEEINYAVKHTKFYPHTEKFPTPTLKEVAKLPSVEVTNETTAQAAQRLLESGHQDIVALNFASATHPGGGWLFGARAQEEDLARCSALYFCLLPQEEFYIQNQEFKSCLYTDNMIYSPKVPFFRDIYCNLIESPFLLSLITAPAPNASFLKEGEEKLLPAFLFRRALKILQVAADNRHKTLILGAWGCGVFGNPPELVAKSFKDCLFLVPEFDHVCFAVYDTRPETPLFKTFEKVILDK